MNMSQSEQEKKRQHYVPRFYLRHFLDPACPPNRAPYLWVFRKFQNTAYRKSPDNIAFEDHFHTLDGPNPYEFENRLSDLEGQAAILLRAILDGTANLRDRSSRYLLAKFVSFMSFRTALSREHFRIQLQNTMKQRFIDGINEVGGLQEFLSREGYEGSIEAESFIDIFNAIKLQPPSSKLFIELMIESVKRIIPFIYDRNLAIIEPESPVRSFITSDHPVLLYNARFDDGITVPGFALPDTDIVFPIAPRLCLHASYNHPEERFRAPDETMVRLNMMIANNCKELVIASTNRFDLLFGSH